jgi:formylglycine-generating enzyme required for sulfatase activity
MARIEKTVFISYRRKDISWALAVYQDLTHQGYDVFFDYTSIPSGDFEQIIISNIKARAHFVLILTPTALDRCNKPGDWLRREIETAINEKRNIIPLFFNGFKFGSVSVSKQLTGKLKNVSRYNGMNVHQDYFREAMERLRTQYLNVPLDAVLHPLSAEVQKVVKDAQLAANEAKTQSPKEKQSRINKQQSKPAEKNYSPININSNSIIKEAKYPADDIKPTLIEKVKPAPVATPPNKITLSNGMELMRVPAGTFLMGSKGSNPIREFFGAPHDVTDEKPQHTVSIPYDYWMARFPVTNELYDAYVKSKGIKHPVNGWEKKKEHPITDLTWTDAMQYCQWLNRRLLLLNELLPAGLMLRLPTEAEWEKAARGTGGREFPWGRAFDGNKCNTIESGKGDTTPVGLYSPQGDSPYGCADMAGNVWEWTQSLFNPYPYIAGDGREDVNASGRRVLRGGSYDGIERYARCAFRNGSPVDPFFLSDIGIRVAAVPKLP